jgi:hypothetical protein
MLLLKLGLKLGLGLGLPLPLLLNSPSVAAGIFGFKMDQKVTLSEPKASLVTFPF